MYYLFFLLSILSISESFRPMLFRNKSFQLKALKNYNEKPLEEMDIFEKFEKYSHENNKEKQAEYLYKIKIYLSRIHKKKSWQKNIKSD